MSLRASVNKDDPKKIVFTFQGDFSRFHLMKVKVLKTIESIESGAVAFDLSGVPYMDSMGIATIMDIHKKLNERSLSFMILSPSPQIARILKLVKVDDVLDIKE
ncbi:MAG: anti-anti-sigma factor [Candidatus Omnitrophota bacterium]|jgi:anti-anti-sigma factor